MQIMICKDGAVVTQNGNTITSSKGDSYVYSQNMLMGSGQTHMNVRSIHEAAGIVAGLHGGRKF